MVSALCLSEASKQILCSLAGSGRCTFRQFQPKTVFCVFASSQLQAFLKAWTSRLLWGCGYLLACSERHLHKSCRFPEDQSEPHRLPINCTFASLKSQGSPNSQKDVDKMKLGSCWFFWRVIHYSLLSGYKGIPRRLTWQNCGSPLWMPTTITHAAKPCSRSSVFKVTVQGAGIRPGGWEGAVRALQLSELYLLCGLAISFCLQGCQSGTFHQH